MHKCGAKTNFSHPNWNVLSFFHLILICKVTCRRTLVELLLECEKILNVSLMRRNSNNKCCHCTPSQI
jgi:hypothetical protein